MSNNTNIKKSEQLGMPFGTAANKLRKLLLFTQAQRLGLLTCYRCGKEITSVEEFSIDHKKPWLDNSPELFWNLDNIAYSHLSCNVRVGRQTRERTTSHGTHQGYASSNCRCDRCTRAHKEYMREYRKR